jgi:hypothetical protein
MRPILIILFFMLICLSAKSQKWQPGSFTDVKGNKVTGLVRENPPGKGPVKDEGFIEFRDDDKTNPYKLSAGDLKSFTIGKDSFVVAHAPHNTYWTKKELDFVQVALDEDIKIYVARVGSGDGGKGFGIEPEMAAGMGSGGYGGVAGGVGINLGGGGGGKKQRTFYYGPNTAEMEQLTPINFKDIMSEVMGDEQDVVDKIQAGQFNINNIDKLIAYFKQVKASHK